MSSQLRLVFHQDVQAILNSFSSLLGIRMAFFSADGEELRVGENRSWCTYCTLLRTRLDADGRCRESDRTRQKEARETATIVHYQCHGGLHESIKPLFLRDGRLLGYVMIGQLRLSDTPPGRYRSAWKQRYNNSELQDAFTRVPCFEPAQLTHILGLFSSLVDYLLQQHMVRAEAPGNLDRVIAHMEEHCNAQFSLADAARLAGRSPSRVAHLFRERHGKSFKEIQAEIILSRADRYLREEPPLSIQEIAGALGFRDPLYFSRFYRKRRGRPPSCVRR